MRLPFTVMTLIASDFPFHTVLLVSTEMEGMLNNVVTRKSAPIGSHTPRGWYRTTPRPSLGDDGLQASWWPDGATPNKHHAIPHSARNNATAYMLRLRSHLSISRTGLDENVAMVRSK